MLTLYGTSACHLCEIAEEMLLRSGADFNKVDIADSDKLFARYGVTIPVLARSDGAELCWPFTEETLLEFLNPTGQP